MPWYQNPYSGEWFFDERKLLGFARNPYTGLTDYTNPVYEEVKPHEPAVITIVRPAEPDGDAFVEWGRGSRFDAIEKPKTDQPLYRSAFETAVTVPNSSQDPPEKPSDDSEESDPDERQDPPDNNNNPGQQTFQWSELSRTSSEVRVENPDDASQYVMVKRVTSLTLRGPDGSTHVFTLKPGD